MNILEVKNLSFGYKKDLLLYDNLNLTLKKGEIISIVGSSGSGKSTLLELIAGNLKPKSGLIKVEKISCVYQDPYTSFHPSYSIINQINDVSNDLKELDFLLNELNINKKLLRKKPQQLSGGQLQRCSILRAILMKPDILLADEPTSALDTLTSLDTMKLIINFLDRFAILLITHDDNLASWCSNKIIRI